MNKFQQREQEPKRRSKGWLWLIIPVVILAGSFAFIRAKAPEPLDINKVLSVRAGQSEYTKDELRFIQKLGFTSSSTIKDNALVLEEETRKEVADKYGLNYIPKIVFEKSILEKHNLIFAPIDRFLRPIPKKNIVELKERLTEINQPQEPKRTNWVLSLNRWNPSDDVIGYVDESDVLPSVVEDFKHGRIHGWGSTWWVSESLKPEIANQFIGKYGDQIVVTYFADIPTTLPRDVESFPVLICAPETYFNMDGLTKKEGSMFEWIVPPPKDPIVVAKYKNGYIILTAWDE